MNTARGVACPGGGGDAPPYVRPAEPTLEDAYLYLSSPGGGHERLDSLGAGAGTRLLRGRLTWLAAALTVLSPLAGLVLYKPTAADTMLSMYLADPALAGAWWGHPVRPADGVRAGPHGRAAGWAMLMDAAVSP